MGEERYDLKLNPIIWAQNLIVTLAFPITPVPTSLIGFALLRPVWVVVALGSGNYSLKCFAGDFASTESYISTPRGRCLLGAIDIGQILGTLRHDDRSIRCLDRAHVRPFKEASACAGLWYTALCGFAWKRHHLLSGCRIQPVRSGTPQILHLWQGVSVLSDLPDWSNDPCRLGWNGC